MLNFLPLTAVMAIVVTLVMAAAWLFIRTQMHAATTAPLPTVQYMSQFFMHMTAFSLCITVPFFWLQVSNSAFSLAMAWGYVIGHIFCYLALFNVSRMVVYMVPQLSGVSRWLGWAWGVFIVVVTIINAVTMIWGVQPIFDMQSNLIQLRAAPIVGGAIIISALFSMFPAAGVFAYNAIKTNGSRRLKSALLSLGFIVVSVAGPMHDVARSATVYAIADIVTIVGIIILGTAVAFRLRQGVAIAPASHAYATASSNTV